MIIVNAYPYLAADLACRNRNRLEDDVKNRTEGTWLTNYPGQYLTVNT